MGNIVTDGSTAGWLPDAKIADPDRTLDHPEWQISHDDFNDLTSAADVIASHLCGEPDGSGAWFLGGYAQTADPLTATLAGIGTGRWHMWPDSTDDAWKFRESGETAERLIFDDQGLGVLKLDSYAGATLSPAGKLWLRNNAGTLQTSYNGGAWTGLAGGGGIAAGDNVTWTGTHSFEGISFNVNPLATFAAGINLTGTLAITGGATISTTLGLAAGAVGAPGLYATGDTNTGIYFPAADQFAITTGGTARVVIDGSTELHSLIQTAPAGSASLPTYGFTGDPNTGAYSIGADQYGITAGGTLRLTVSTTGVTSTLPVLGPSGSAAAPGLAFSTEPDCGLFIGGANTMGLATAGSQRILIDTALITMQLPVAAAVGSVSAPGYTFDSDGDLGLYRVAANTLGISTGNFLKMELGDATKNIALRATTATTNAVQRLQTLEAICSGTAAIGFGAALTVNMDNASAAQITAGEFHWSWLNATAASEAALLSTRIRKAGSTNTVEKLSDSYKRYALNGGVFKDSSAFEVIVGGAGADGRGRFENNISSTGVSGIISTNDNNWSGTMLVDGGGTTRTGVAGNTYFVGLTSQAHFGALTNTDSHWISGTADSTADRVASAVYNSGDRYLRIGYFTEYAEMSAPAAGAANTARVFAVDNGSGKTVLKVQFATGAAQTIATEP